MRFGSPRAAPMVSIILPDRQYRLVLLVQVNDVEINNERSGLP